MTRRVQGASGLQREHRQDWNGKIVMCLTCQNALVSMLRPEEGETTLDTDWPP